MATEILSKRSIKNTFKIKRWIMNKKRSLFLLNM
nr:MAG TPA: hypothetical protein [Caudoviricetes sp.]